MLKSRMYAIVAVILIMSQSACSGGTTASGAVAVESSESVATGEGVSSGDTFQTAVEPGEVDVDDVDLGVTADASAATIQLQEDGIHIDGSGVNVDGSLVTVTAGGDYILEGSLEDGQIVVDSTDEEIVHLFLNGVDLTSLTTAPLYIRNAEKVVVTLMEGTMNALTDAEMYAFDSPDMDEPNAALFSNDDLVINGTGSLVVHAQFAHGIACDDDLLIVSGQITVNAVNDGIKGKDSLVILDGDICVVAGADGMQSQNDTDPEEGYILIQGGMLELTSGLDAIQAETSILVEGGDIRIVAGNGSEEIAGTVDMDMREPFSTSAAAGTDDSAKGLKAGVAIMVMDGTLQIDARDDGLHSNQDILIEGGQFIISSNDDGIHADVSLTINGGDVAIIRAYEGIESQAIIINGGTMNITSSDDGINASSGSAAGGQMGGGMVVDSSLEINGGIIVVDSGGDGLDANGNGLMTGGVVFVSGPDFSGNSALDFNGELLISGGYIVAAGSLGMAEAPGASSSQLSVMVNFPVELAGGTPFQLESADGDVIAAVAPTNAYQSVVVSSPDLQAGETYTVSVGGTLTEINGNMLVIDGRYADGTEFASLTIAESVTVVGESVGSGGMMGGGARGRR